MNELINLIGMKKEKGRLFEKPFSNSLILTFNIDFLFYENTILNEFLNLGSANNILFADQNQLLASEDTQFKFISRDASSYVFHGVKIGNLFHPKAILLTSDDESRLFIGSGNMTFSGLSLNKELYKEFSTHEQSDLTVFTAFKSYIDSLTAIIKPKPFIKSRIEQCFAVNSLQELLSENTSTSFLHNLKEPMLAQINEEIKATKRIYIISPFYDKDFHVLTYLKENIQKDIQIFVQPDYTNFSVEDFQNDVSVFALPPNSRHTHAKLFIFEYENSLSLLFGSPNCTRPALLENAINGNTEIAIFLKNVDKSLLSYYHLTDPQPLNLKEIIPLPPFSSQKNPKFILKESTYTKDDMLKITFLKQLLETDKLIFRIDNKIVGDIAVTKNEEEDAIIFPYTLEPNKIHYLSVLLNDQISNTVIIQNEQKDLFNIDTAETKAMNKLKNVFAFNSVEDIIFARSFDPFILIKSVSTREYSNEDETLEEEVKKEQATIKEIKDYYVSFKEVQGIAQLKEISGLQKKSFIFDLLATVPQHFTMSESHNVNSGSVKLTEKEIAQRDDKPQYKKFVDRLLQRVFILARVYQTTKKYPLDTTSFMAYFRDAAEIIPLLNLLMAGLTYKMPDNEKLTVLYLTPYETKELIIPLLEIIIAFWKNAADHHEFIKNQIPKKYLVRLLSLSISNLLLLEHLYRSRREDSEMVLNQDKYLFFFYTLSFKLLQAICNFSIEPQLLEYELGHIKKGLLNRIFERYDWDIKIENDYSTFILLSSTSKDTLSNKQLFMELQRDSKLHPEKSMLNQLNKILIA